MSSGVNFAVRDESHLNQFLFPDDFPDVGKKVHCGKSRALFIFKDGDDLFPIGIRVGPRKDLFESLFQEIGGKSVIRASQLKAPQFNEHGVQFSFLRINSICILLLLLGGCQEGAFLIRQVAFYFFCML